MGSLRIPQSKDHLPICALGSFCHGSLSPGVGLAEMEFIFPTADLRGLCFALGARKVLMTNQCFVLLRVAGKASRLSQQHFPFTSRLKMSEISEGDTAGTADPN